MPLVCINRPNRSKPRTWGPPGLTRVFEKVCETHGKDEAWAAVQRARCGQPTDLEQLLKDLEDIINGLLESYAALKALISAAEKVFASVYWRFFFRYFPGASALEEGVAFLAELLETSFSAEELAAALEVIAEILALLA